MLQAAMGMFGLPALRLLRPEWRMDGLFLICTAALALVVCALRLRGRGPGAIGRAFGEVFDRKVFFHRSAITDYQFVLINRLLALFVLGSGVASAQAMIQLGAVGLARLLGPSPALVPGWSSAAVLTVAVFVASDFANFYFHRLQHSVPFLWELHKVHHSAEVLTPLTASRVHPITELLGAQFIALCIAAVTAPYLYLYGGTVSQVTILGLNALVFLWHAVLGKHLAHAHVWVMFPKPLRGLFYSPALHLIHHSADPRHFGRNLGFCLVIWDRMAGTHYQPADEERHGLTLGIDSAEMADYRTPWQLYWTPLRNIARAFAVPKDASAAAIRLTPAAASPIAARSLAPDLTDLSEP